MRRTLFALLVSTGLMAFAPAGSWAQGLPSDPEADSPSGVVYELPVDQARKDAAPRRQAPRNQGGGQSGGSGSGGGNASPPSNTGGSGVVASAPETSIRSENNFGTSSEVPGAPNKGKRSRQARRDSGGDGKADKRDAEESSSAAGDAVKRIAASSSATTDGPSDSVVFPLLLVVLAVGAAIGGFAGHRSLRNRRSD